MSQQGQESDREDTLHFPPRFFWSSPKNCVSASFNPTRPVFLKYLESVPRTRMSAMGCHIPSNAVECMASLGGHPYLGSDY